MIFHSTEQWMKPINRWGPFIGKINKFISKKLKNLMSLKDSTSRRKRMWYPHRIPWALDPESILKIHSIFQKKKCYMLIGKNLSAKKVLRYHPDINWCKTNNCSGFRNKKRILKGSNPSRGSLSSSLNSLCSPRFAMLICIAKVGALKKSGHLGPL